MFGCSCCYTVEPLIVPMEGFLRCLLLVVPTPPRHVGSVFCSVRSLVGRFLSLGMGLCPGCPVCRSFLIFILL